MGPETIELLLMEPSLLGDQFLNNVLCMIHRYNGRHKQKKAFRDWLFRHRIRFDKVRIYLDNIFFYFTESDMECFSEGLLDTRVYTERGFNPKICHYSADPTIRKQWTEPYLRLGIRIRRIRFCDNC